MTHAVNTVMIFYVGQNNTDHCSKGLFLKRDTQQEGNKTLSYRHTGDTDTDATKQHELDRCFLTHSDHIQITG